MVASIVLSASLLLQAQQASTQTTQSALPVPTAQAKPCVPTTAAAPAKHARFHLPITLQQQIEKQRAKLLSKTGVDIDGNGVLSQQINKPLPCANAAPPSAETK